MKNGPLRTCSFAIALLTIAGFQAQERTIYPEHADAKASIRHAIEQAARSHKRVLLDFGGNWCGDCKALDNNFHKEPNASLLKDNFVLVDINIGHFDLNKGIAEQYGVPLEKGVPALAVLDFHGHVLYSQKNGEFESMRTIDASSVTEFLKKWKG